MSNDPGGKQKARFCFRVLRQAGKGGLLRLRLEQRAATFVVSQNELKMDEPVLVIRGILRVVECERQPLKLREKAMSWIASRMRSLPEIVLAVHKEGLLCEMLASLASREEIGSDKIRDAIQSALFYIAEHCDQCNERMMTLLPGLASTIQGRFERMNTEPMGCFTDLLITVKLLSRHFEFFWKRDRSPPWSPMEIAKPLWRSALFAFSSGDEKTPRDIIEFLCNENDVGPSGAFIRAFVQEIVSDEALFVAILEKDRAQFHARVLHLAANDSETRFYPERELEAAVFISQAYYKDHWEGYGSSELAAGMVRVAASVVHPQSERLDILYALSSLQHDTSCQAHNEHSKMHEALAASSLCDGAADFTEGRDLALDILRCQAEQCTDCNVTIMTRLRDLGPVMRDRFSRMHTEPFADCELLVEGALPLTTSHYDFHFRRDGAAPWDAGEMARTIWMSTREFIKFDETHFTVGEVYFFATFHSDTRDPSVAFVRALYEEIVRDDQMQSWVCVRIADSSNARASHVAWGVASSVESAWSRALFPSSWVAPLLDAAEIRLEKPREQPSDYYDTEYYNDLVEHLTQIVYLFARHFGCKLLEKRTRLLRSLLRIGLDQGVSWMTLSNSAKVFETLLSQALEPNLEDVMDSFLGAGMLGWLIALTTRPHKLRALGLPRISMVYNFFRRFPEEAQKIVEKFGDDRRAASAVILARQFMRVHSTFALQAAAVSSFSLSASAPLTSLMDAHSCAVCLRDMDGRERRAVLWGCAHACHAACLMRWLSQNGSCPICRSDFKGIHVLHGTEAIEEESSFAIVTTITCSQSAESYNDAFLACGHSFHSSCLLLHLATHADCPECCAFCDIVDIRPSAVANVIAQHVVAASDADFRDGENDAAGSANLPSP